MKVAVNFTVTFTGDSPAHVADSLAQISTAFENSLEYRDVPGLKLESVNMHTWPDEEQLANRAVSAAGGAAIGS